MSDRPCNLCSLERIKLRARQDEQRIVVLPARREDKYFLGGVDVFRFPKSLMTIPEFKKLNHKAQKNWRICWFMKLPERCVC